MDPGGPSRDSRASRVKKALVIAAALLAVAAATLWMRRGDVGSVAPQLVRPAAPTNPQRAPSSAVAPVVATPAMAPPARDDGTAALAVSMAERWQSLVGRRYVAYLAEQGLARTDAERIVAALALEVADCGLEAMRAQAQAQQVPFDDVLNALEAQLHDADGPPLTAVLDMRAVALEELQCSLSALQRSGISPEAATELLLEAINERGLPRTGPR